MNLTSLDWLVLAVPVAIVAMVALKTRKYTRSVADFMAASSESTRQRPVAQVVD